MAQFKYVGTIASMGEDLVIWIPKKFHDQVKDLRGKQIRIVIDDAI